MDTEDHHGYGRGGGRRARGYNRGRHRYRNPRNYQNAHYNHYEEGGFQDSSQKDEAYHYEDTPDNYRPRGRGHRRGARRGQRGAFRGDRGGFRSARGGPRRGRGAHAQHYEEDQPFEHDQQNSGKEEDDFGFNPKKNYGYSNKPVSKQTHDYGEKPIPKQEYKKSEKRPMTSGPPINYVPDEEVKAYYNAEDFISKYDNLPEKTEYLVRGLCEASLSCSICHNEIAQAAAIWSCRQCYQPLHLGCIKRWINKVNADGPVEFNPYENAKEEYDEEGNEVVSGDVQLIKDKAGNVIMQQTSHYTWTCPNCAYNYTEEMPEYYCFCRKDPNPDLSLYYLPHSCSKVCNKAKNPLCKHTKCNIECHPGACVPCEEFVSISCHCGKESRKVTCHARSQKQAYSCRDICGKTLECFNHVCEETCHEGNCAPCKQKETIECYCGQQELEVECGSSGASCGNICKRTLNCGQHTCTRQCHLGDCGECDLVPEKIKYCPCGRTSLKNMGSDQLRQSCTDPIPTCNAICGRVLPCGKHHCSKSCHQGPCNLCDELIIDICRCERGQRKVRCYQTNYPMDKVAIYGENLLKKVQEFREAPFICNKKCGKFKSCRKHRCQRLCCNVTTRESDRDGAHICTDTCGKPLACGKHKCLAFCHIGQCEPCAVFSNQPLYCPCGKTALQPPVRCGEHPYCVKKCPRIHEDCGHPCGQQCHPGECFPCTEGVSKLCICGKVMLENIKCGEKEPSCGHICDIEMPCGHKCPKMCHDHQAYEESGAIENGCSQKCNKKRKNCEHKCQEKCHGVTGECPDEPCDAEIKVFCKCGYRYVMGVCARFDEGYEDVEEDKQIECNPECVKNKRDAQIAKAFSSKDTDKQKELRADYYPEYLIKFAQSNLKIIGQVEKILEKVVKLKTSKTLPGIDGPFLSPIAALVKEHYFCDMCTYGGRGVGAKVTDVYYKDENSKIPSTLLSDYVKLIKKGVVSSEANERKEKLFEASIKIPSLPIGMSKEDLKRNLIGFHSEFYTEKIGKKSGYYFHFYSKFRAEEAYKKLRNSAGGFTGVDLIIHGEENKAKFAKKKKKNKAAGNTFGFVEV